MMCILKSYPLKLVIGLLVVIGGLKPEFRMKFGSAIGSFIYLIAERRRTVAEQNIKVCIEENSQSNKVLVRRCFQELGIGLLEMVRTWSVQKQKILSEVRIVNSQVVMDAKSQGGVLILVPHYSMLELSAPVIENVVGRFVISYRPHEIVELEGIIHEGRSRYGKLLNVRFIKGLLRALKDGEVLWFGPDQDMGTKGSVFAPFFGRPASTVTTPSWLARKSGCTVFFLEMSRDESGYHARFKSMPSGYPFDDEVQNATILNQMIEDSLKHNPAQYMWMHQRFKTQPDLPRYALYK